MKRRPLRPPRFRRISRILWALLQRIGSRTTDWVRARRGSGYPKPPSTAWCYTLQPLEPRLLLCADLIGGTLSHDALTPGIPGEPVSALVEVYRPDSESLASPVRIKLYASTDGVLDAADTVVGQTDVAADKLSPGNNAIKVSLDTRAIVQPGPYRLIGVIDPDNVIAESDETNNQSLASSPLFLDFAVGQVPGRSPVPSLDLTDADGTHFTLSISGPGLARLTPNGNSYHLDLSGTDASTRVELAGSGGDGHLTLTGITADSALGSLLAPLASLNGPASFTTVNSLSLGDIAAGARLEGDSLANLTVSRDALGDLRLSGSGVSGFVLGSAQVGGALGGLWSVSGRANTISAQNTRADWRANISKPLSQVVIRGDASGQLAAEALQLLQVGGSLKGMSLRIGASLGSDAEIGGSGDAADHFGPGTLARLRVTGNIEDSLILIGIDPHNGHYQDGDDLQLGTPTRRVQELLVGGRLTGSTQISAPAFPASVRINGVARTPASLGELATTPPDRSAPTLSAVLLDDSGRSASDGITRDASISGQASDAGGVTRLLAALDPLGTPSFVDLSSALQPDGRFVLMPALLGTLAGGTLADGAHTVRLVAQDAAGNASTPKEIGFFLDTLAPKAPSFGLSLASDTDSPADGGTAAAIVTLQGSAEPGSELNLNPGDQTALAGAGGVFQFANVALAAGANPFTLTATDTAGNTSLPAVQTFTREGVAATDAVSTWHAETLATIVRDAEDAPAASRTLAIESLAVFDVVNAFEGTPSFAVGLRAPARANLDAAIAAAAHRVLVGLYPGQAQALDARLATSLATIPNGQAKTDGVAFGVTLADAILALRAGDGYKDFVDYPGSTALGQWRPTGPTFELAALPQWADVVPFVLTSPEALRPGAPPALDSAAYAAALEEVRALGSAASTLRTADQTETVHFWADGPGTTTPSGHWNQIAAQIAQQQGLSAGAKARLFAQLNVALADAGVAAWDAKYFYGLWRPETAVANAAADGNDATQFEANWSPRLITPNHPEYVSGHSSYSAAAAAVLESVFGESFAFDATSPGLPRATRHFTSFEQAAQEAGRSRIFGGIHFEFTNQTGQQLGREVADAVLARFALNEDTQGPSIVLEATPEASNQNLTISGQVLDNLAGVAALQVQIDPVDDFEGEGDPPPPQVLPLTFDALGRFSFTTDFALDGSDDGQHVLRFTATDAAGNPSAPFDVGLMIDTRAPVITITSLTDGGQLGADSRASGTADPTGTALATLGYAFGGGATVPLIFDASSGSFDEALDLSRLGTGAHQLTITARDAAGNQASSTLNLTLAQAVPLTVTRTSPEPGSDDVGSTFRPQVFFSRAVDPATLSADTFYATDTTGAKLPATIVTGDDGRFAWLFFQGPMPGASTITVHLKAADIHAAGDGQALDADGDGTPEADFTWRFSTVSLASIPGTTITGTLLDPGPDFEPMTFDDIRRGPDGIPHTADDVFLNPIAHAHVHVLGRPDLSNFTDANGRFELVDLPAGNVKLVINGTTATNAPAGHYWPEMTLDLTLEAGLPNTVMGSMGTREEMAANEERTEVYLPRLKSAILQQVANNQPATITLDPASTTDLTPQQVAQLKLEFQPGSLIGEDGQPLANAQIGISTVPPELVRDMLPPGVLQHTFDITIQAPGVAAFSEPLQISFPNVFNAEPGTKLNFLSFDHTTGRLVIEGTATVSADGHSVLTDPGTGITKPGWHGLVPPGRRQEFGSSRPCDEGVAELLALAGKNLWSAIKMIADSTGLVDKAIAGEAPFKQISLISKVENAYQTFKNKDGIAGLELVLDVVEEIEGPIGVCAKVAGLIVDGIDVVDDFYDFKIRTQELALKDPCINPFLLDPQQMANESAQAIDDLIAKANSQRPMLDQMRRDLEAIEREIEIATPPESPKDPPQPTELSAEAIDAITLALESYLLNGRAIVNQGAFYESLATAVDRASKVFELYGLCDPFPIGRPSGGGGGNGGGDGGAEVAPVPHTIYWLAELDESLTIRGSSRSDRTVDIFLPANKLIRFSLYDPKSDEIGSLVLFSDLVGRNFKLCVPTFDDPNALDTDSDGLSDDAEFIIGTKASTSDTDADSLTDYLEALENLTPLGGRSLPTGIVASLPLQGQAKAVVLEGSTTSAETQTAYVATGSHGLAIVNASNFRQPIVLGQFDLPGDAVDVAVDSRLGITAVATGTGLQLVDVTDPAKPTLRQTVNVAATQVEVFNGIAYVAAGGSVEAYSVLTGERLQALPLGGRGLTGLAREGQVLYTLDSSRTMRAVDISGLHMQARGSIALPAGTGKLFVGDGVAYVGAGDGDLQAGFVTVDVSNPDALALISGVDANNIQGRAIVANGSGLAVSVGNFTGPPPARQPVRQVNVLDVRDPANTAGFITSFDLPADPYDLAIGAGMAFVADGTSGLMVVNYQAFDNLGQDPAAALTVVTPDADPAKPGIQLPEGSLVDLRANVADDRQVRNVELLVDGQVVRNDVSFPWDFSAALPLLDPGQPTASLQLRATDTGGNRVLSNAVTIELDPDSQGPTVIGANIIEGSLQPATFRTIQVQFSEAIDPTDAVPAGFVLYDTLGRAIAPTDVALRSNGSIAQITVPSLGVGAYRLVALGDQIHDRAGNPLGSGEVAIRGFEITNATIQWTGALSSDWSNPGNWDLGRVPDADDVVLISSKSVVAVAIAGPAVNVRGLESFSALNVSTTLTIGDRLIAHEGVALNGGAIRGGTLDLGQGKALIVSTSQYNRLQGITVNGDLDLGANGALVRFKDVVLNGTATLGSGSTIGFEGTQRLEGNATIVFTSPHPSYYGQPGYLEMVTAGTLTLGSNVLVRGGYGVVGSGVPWRWNASMTLVNEGTIRADTNGRFIQLGDGTHLSSLSNVGLIEATNGAALYVRAASSSNEATGRVNAAGGTLDIAGSSFANAGTLAVTAGAALVAPSNRWNSVGTIAISGGTLTLGGQYALADFGRLDHPGGSVVITGSVDNVGRTLTLGATPGNWVLDGGAIDGGTLNVGANEALVLSTSLSNRLLGMTINGDLDLGADGAVVRFKDVVLNGTATLGNGSTIGFEGTQRLEGNATIVFTSPHPSYYGQPGYLEMVTAGTLTLGSNVLVRGGYGVVGSGVPWRWNASMTLVNEGRIRADTNGRFIQLGDGTHLSSLSNVGLIEAINGGSISANVAGFVNNGTVGVAASGGTFQVTGIDFTNTGTIEALGGTTTVSASVFTNMAGIRAEAGALLQLSGAVSLAPTSMIQLVLGGSLPSQFGRIVSTGLLTLDGVLRISLSGGYIPHPGEQFGFLTLTGRTGEFAALEDEDGVSAVSYELAYNSTGIVVSAVAG